MVHFFLHKIYDDHDILRHDVEVFVMAYFMHITAYLRNIMHISCMFPSFFCVSVHMLAYDCKCQSDSFQLLSPGARPVPSQPLRRALLAILVSAFLASTSVSLLV